VRLFVAAELPPQLRAAFASVQREMAGAPLSVRWVRPEAIHLTLKFLGEVREERLAEILTALRGSGAAIAPFLLEAAGASVFPARGAPRLIWVEVRGNLPAARGLAAAIDSATARVGFPPEAREFRPHLTLGRVKGPGRGDWRSILERAALQATGEFQVSEHVLFESRLGPGGAVYTPIERFRLGSAADLGESR
jgi:RNA 2',3'-cyclic 3'-phosphodiesterase